MPPTHRRMECVVRGRIRALVGWSAWCAGESWEVLLAYGMTRGCSEVLLGQDELGLKRTWGRGGRLGERSGSSVRVLRVLEALRGSFVRVLRVLEVLGGAFVRILRVREVPGGSRL